MHVKEIIVFGSNYRNRDFNGFVFEVPWIWKSHSQAAVLCVCPVSAETSNLVFYICIIFCYLKQFKKLGQIICIQRHTKEFLYITTGRNYELRYFVAFLRTLIYLFCMCLLSTKTWNLVFYICIIYRNISYIHHYICIIYTNIVYKEAYKRILIHYEWGKLQASLFCSIPTNINLFCIHRSGVRKLTR